MKKLILLYLPLATYAYAMNPDKGKMPTRKSVVLATSREKSEGTTPKSPSIGVRRRTLDQQKLSALRNIAQSARDECAQLKPPESSMSSYEYLIKKLDEASEFEIKQAALNFDETLIVALAENGCVQLWCHRTMKLLDPFVRLYETPVQAIEFEFVKNGVLKPQEKIAITTEEKKEYLDIINDEALKKIRCFYDDKNSIALQKCQSPSGSHIATLDADGVRVFTKSGDIFNLYAHCAHSHNKPIKSISFDTLGRLKIDHDDIVGPKLVKADPTPGIYLLPRLNSTPAQCGEFPNKDKSKSAYFDNNEQMLHMLNTEGLTIAAIKVEQGIKSLRFFRNSDFIMVTHYDGSRQIFIVEEEQFKSLQNQGSFKYAGYYVVNGIVQKDLALDSYMTNTAYKDKIKCLQKNNTTNNKCRVQFITTDISQHYVPMLDCFAVPIESVIEKRPHNILLEEIGICRSDNLFIKDIDGIDMRVGIFLNPYDLALFMLKTGLDLETARSHLLLKMNEK